MLDAFSRSYLSTAVFWSRAMNAWGRLTPSQIRMRRGEGTKQIVEEILPIASFLKAWEVPGRRVRCRYCPGNQAHDARIRLEGNEVEGKFLHRAYFIEVTSALEPKEYLRREALERQGGVFVGGPIKRLGSRRSGNDRIESHAEARDPDSFVADLAAWTRAAIAQKQSKTYPSPCILLVNVQPDSPRPSILDWASIAARLRGGDTDSNQFAATFIVHPWTSMVFGIGPSKSPHLDPYRSGP